MSELQNAEESDIYEDVELEEVEEELPPDEYEDEGAEDEGPAELATDSEGEHEENAQVELTEKTQKDINGKFARLTFEREQEKREKEALQAQLDALQTQQFQASEPVIPGLPDAFDDDYDSKMAAREKAIADKALHDQRKQAVELQQQQRNEAVQLQQQQEFANRANVYNERAKKLGVSSEQLKQSATVLTKIGLSPDVVNHILDDEHGPLLTAHLGSNVDKAIELTNMNPIQAALYLERSIKPKLQVTAKKTKTPAPKKRVSGNMNTAKSASTTLKRDMAKGGGFF